MQSGTYSLERSLEDCLNDAIQKAVKNPCGKDPFGSALRTSMDTFALHLPVCLQQDGITTRETLPTSRNVTVTSVSNEDPNKKTSHILINSVNQGVIVLNQPIFYTVKKGDTLSEISWKLTGRKASVRDLKNWNSVQGDVIKPGQILYLADPNDSFVKEIASKLSKHELTGRNPKISLDRLSGEMVAQHGGLFNGEYQVQLKLEYNEPWNRFLNPEFSGPPPEQEIPSVPDYSRENGLDNSFDQPNYPDEVRLDGGDFMGFKATQNESILNAGFGAKPLEDQRNLWTGFSIAAEGYAFKELRKYPDPLPKPSPHKVVLRQKWLKTLSRRAGQAGLVFSAWEATEKGWTTGATISFAADVAAIGLTILCPVCGIAYGVIRLTVDLSGFDVADEIDDAIGPQYGAGAALDYFID